MSLGELLNNVNDRASFLCFVRALINDRQCSVELEKLNSSNPYDRDAGGWENVSIESYLKAALAWAEATQMGLTQGLSESPSWKEFAVFLYCGKIYE